MVHGAPNSGHGIGRIKARCMPPTQENPMDAFTEAVQRGAALLDDLDPQWFEHIDLGRLDMGECARCILGQIYGNYTTGLDRIGNDLDQPAWLGYSRDLEVSHGFEAEVITPADYIHLSLAWTAEIRRRRKGGK
jgi:hypothetical protein